MINTLIIQPIFCKLRDFLKNLYHKLFPHAIQSEALTRINTPPLLLE
jgi:hypothetical protein